MLRSDMREHCLLLPLCCELRGGLGMTISALLPIQPRLCSRPAHVCLQSCLQHSLSDLHLCFFYLNSTSLLQRIGYCPNLETVPRPSCPKLRKNPLRHETPQCHHFTTNDRRLPLKSALGTDDINTRPTGCSIVHFHYPQSLILVASTMSANGEQNLEQGNKAYAASFTQGHLALPPSQKYAVCM